MKPITIVVFAYKSSSQLRTLVNHLDHELVNIVIHFDKQGKLIPFLPVVSKSKISLAPYQRNISWGGAGVTKVQIDVIKHTKQSSHILFITEDTIPVYPIDIIINRLMTEYHNKSIFLSQETEWPGISMANVLPKNLHRNSDGLLVKTDYLIMSITKRLGQFLFKPYLHRGRAWICVSAHHASQLRAQNFFTTRIQQSILLSTFLSEEFFLPSILMQNFAKDVVQKRSTFANYALKNPSALQVDEWLIAREKDHFFARKSSDALWEFVIGSKLLDM